MTVARTIAMRTAPEIRVIIHHGSECLGNVTDHPPGVFAGSASGWAHRGARAVRDLLSLYCRRRGGCPEPSRAPAGAVALGSRGAGFAGRHAPGLWARSAARRRAARAAIAMAVSVGFFSGPVVKQLASQTMTLGAS